MVETARVGRLRGVVRVALVLATVLSIIGQQSQAAEAFVETVPVVLAPSGAVALGMATSTSAVATYAALGGVAVGAATAGVVVGGLLIGWGIVEATEWAWDELTGGDPEPATLTGEGYAVDDTVSCPDMTHPDMDTLSCPGASAMLVGTVQAQADGTGTQIEFDHGPYADPDTCTGNWTILLVKDNGDHIASSGGTTGCGWPSPTVVEVGGEVGPCCGNNNEFQWLAWQHSTEAEWEWRRFHYDQMSGGEAAEDRQLKTEAQCFDPATSTTTTVTETSALYAPGSEPLTPGVVCPTGTHVSGLTVTRTIEGDDGTKDETLFTATPVVPLTGTQYDDCTDGSCELMLHRINPDTSRSSCADESVLCVGWITDTDRHLNYECLWGTHVVPLGDCEMFHQADLDTATVGTLTKPDTGVDSDLTTTGDRTLEPGTPTAPGEEPSGCVNSIGWGWLNPFSGMAQAAACAIEWAFVPQATDLNTTVLEPLMDAWWASPPGIVVDVTTTGLVNMGGIGWDRTGSCSGMIIDLTPDALRDDGYNPVGGYPDLDTGFPTRIGVPCEPPFSWTIPYGVMTSAIALGGLLGAYNMVARTIGAPSEGSSVQFNETSW